MNCGIELGGFVLLPSCGLSMEETLKIALSHIFVVTLQPGGGRLETIAHCCKLCVFKGFIKDLLMLFEVISRLGSPVMVSRRVRMLPGHRLKPLLLPDPTGPV